MLAALNQHCQHNSVANVLTTLTLLFNDSMTNSKKIMAFCSRFNEMVNNMAWCKIIIPPILLVMFFLWSLHPCYEALLKQLHSWYKSLESASLDSIVAYVRYHDEFKLVDLNNKKSPAGKTPRAATAATNVDKQGKEWNNLLSGFPRSKSIVAKSSGSKPLWVTGSVPSAIAWTTDMSRRIALFSVT